MEASATLPAREPTPQHTGLAPLWCVPSRVAGSVISADPLEVLQQVWGYPGFRGPQEAIVRHVIGGGSGLVLMPTGGGKSICFQVPALCRAGLGVVVSPLIALMQDQVQALRQAGVRAGALHSALAPEERAALWRQLNAGELELLYVSPERLLADDLQQRLGQLPGEQPLALFAIDEAHCVSQWGHDFRPEYIQLEVLAERFPEVPRLALTATADPRTREEIVKRLRLEQGEVFLASFDRPNIRYLLRGKDNPKAQLLRFLEEHRGEAGIVYARSRSRVDRLTQELQGAGHDAVAYHAGLESGVRNAAQERFRNDAAVVVVATIAFGMGIDKPDVRFVAHVDLPKSLEAYYQETGRAGRDGLAAVAWMIHGPGDVPQLRHIARPMNHPGHRRQAVASGPAGLLVVGLQALGQVHVGDETHIRLVDAHPEGDRGHHHHGGVVAEALLGGVTHAALQSGVVGHRVVAGPLQLLRQPVHSAAGARVDDASLTAMLLQKAQQLRLRVVLAPQQVADVGPIEAGQEHLSLLQPQPLYDLLTGARIRRGGERQARHLRKALGQHLQLDVLGPEVVPPLRHAVGLIDRKQGQRLLARQLAQSLLQVVRQQPLGRHVEQLELAGVQLPPQRRPLLRRQGRMQRSGPHPRLAQRLHLVLHQGDQGRHHHAQPRSTQCRHLKTDRLAAAGGHQHQPRPAADHVPHDRLLRPAEARVAPNLLQHLQRIGRDHGPGDPRWHAPQWRQAGVLWCRLSRRQGCGGLHWSPTAMERSPGVCRPTASHREGFAQEEDVVQGRLPGLRPPRQATDVSSCRGPETS